MMRLVSKLIFQMLGWSVIGHTKYPRKSLVICPHTSNWDFFTEDVMRILLDFHQNI